MIILLFIIVFFSQTLFTQNNEIHDILYHQDQRITSDGKLFKYLNHENPDIASAAAIALANIQDTAAIDPLIIALKDSRYRVSSAATFALGQIGPNKKSETALLEILENCENDSLKVKIFEALGKVGGIESLNQLVDVYVNDDELIFQKILVIARYGIRKIRTEKALDFVIKQATKRKNINIKSVCAFALWRIGDKNLLNKHQEEIIQLFQEKNTYTKMWAVNILNSLDTNEQYLKTLLDCLKDSDWEVQVNVFKALEKYKIPIIRLDLILSKTFDPNEHISLSAIKFLKNIKPTPDPSYTKIINRLNNIIENSNDRYTWNMQGEAAISLSNLVMNDNDGLKFITPLLKAENIKLKAKAITALGNLGSEKTLNFLLNSMKDKEPIISMSKIDAITNIFKKIKPNRKNLEKIKKLFIQMLNDGDLAVVTTIATATSDSIFKNLIPYDIWIKTFTKMKSPDDVEAMVEIIKTLEDYNNKEVIAFLEKALKHDEKTIIVSAVNVLNKLTKKNYNDFIPSNSEVLYSDYDWPYLEKISKKPFISIETEEGTIKVRLYPDKAPFTVLSICKLIDKNFYDNLDFHRVVPNFVIQGGDPRGDGWGGPGYSIRTEVSYLNFKRGMVGIASAGKDTEGCQFFITHSPQPHLDGKYTIFGEVVEGMDAVDKIQEGDKIIKISR